VLTEGFEKSLISLHNWVYYDLPPHGAQVICPPPLLLEVTLGNKVVGLRSTCSAMVFMETG
jgi:hypothetical protein